MPKLGSDIVNKKRTICEVHRELYRLVKDDPRAVRLLEEAFNMGKSMAKRLAHYKFNYEESCEENKNYYRSVRRQIEDNRLDR